MADNTQKNIQATTGNWFVDKLSLYQSANSDNSSIKKNFVIRQEEFELIIDSLANKKNNDPLQHELVLGRRGSGKSTLLRRIQAEVEENPALQKKYIAINLAEEQAGIYRLFDLWEEVLKEISIKLNEQLPVKNYDDFDDNNTYTRHLYDVIHEALSRHNKKVVLLLDNFDRIVTNFTDDGSLLREILMNHNDIVLVAGSTRMDEHFWKYDQPFYEFFRRHRLEALDIKEIIELLNHWSKVMELPQLAQFAKNNIGKLEAIRILTDGLPRTLQFFIQILLQNSDLYGYEYLRKVMDNVTTLYQERLNNLPAAQRKIIAEMAFIWEACATKELAEKCRMESKLVSANIKQLSNAGIVDTLTTDKKNHLYRIAERFFNMWLIVTQGNPEQKRKAKWLSIFLETWYDGSELKQLAGDHISNLKDKKIGYDKALVFTKAFAQSRYITTMQRDELLDLTAAIQPDGVNTPLLQLPKKYSAIADEIIKLVADKNFTKALELANEIENEVDGVKFFILGYIYAKKGNWWNSEKQYLLAIEKGNTGALNNLANLYKEQEKFSEAEKYYLLAIEKGHVSAHFNFANLYKAQAKFSEAEKYYLLAIEKGDTDAFNNLANLYKEQEKFSEAEKYYLLAIEKGDVNALNNLANLYSDQGKFSEAEKHYLVAIEKGHVGAHFNLANLYNDQEKFSEAEKYYLLAIEKGHVNALNNLANLYSDQGKFSEAEKYYLLAIEKGDTGALNNLAILYKAQEKFSEAEKYYLLAIEKGHIDAHFNLANLYKAEGKFSEAEKYYLLAIEKGHVKALNNLANLYDDQEKFSEAEKYYLLAIEKGDTGALNNLAILYKAQEKFSEAEKYYLLAIEKGNTDALNNLAILYNEQKKFSEAEKYYLLAIKKGHVDAHFNLANLYDDHEKFSEAEKHYLLAIEKGDTDALNNLANLYSTKEKFSEAEKYYLLAIEKGDADAPNNLAVLYYEQNIQKQAALEFITAHNTKVKDSKPGMRNQISIEVWNGIFDGLDKKIESLIKENGYDSLELFLTELLYHEQASLVYNLFTHALHGEELQKRYTPLYYAVLLLSNKTGNNLELRIPPEILPTVKNIVDTVKERQQFYNS